jgi:PAS domain-containing protein
MLARQLTSSSTPAPPRPPAAATNDPEEDDLLDPNLDLGAIAAQLAAEDERRRRDAAEAIVPRAQRARQPLARDTLMARRRAGGAGGEGSASPPPRMMPPPARARALPTASAAPRKQRSPAADNESDDDEDDDEDRRQLAALQRSIERKALAAGLPPEAVRGALQDALSGKGGKAGQEGLLQGLAAMGGGEGGGGDSDDDEEEDEDDDLFEGIDFDALSKANQYAEYVRKQERERRDSDAAAQRAQRQQPPQAPAAAPPAAAAKPAARALPPPPPAPAPPPPKPPAAPPAPKPATDDRTSLERELDEMESLVSFFEALEGGGRGAPTAKAREPLQRPSGPRQQQQQQPPASSSSRTADDQWGEVERFLLGEGWDKAALDEIERELAEAAAAASAAPAAASSSPSALVRPGSGVATQLEQQEEENNDDDQEPWVDDVTTLLLGLVQLSHERYTRGLRQEAEGAATGAASAPPAAAVTAPLLPKVAGPDGQDARARAFWAAPFPVLAFDDAADARVEYCNRAAAEMLLLPPPLTAQGGKLSDADAGEGYLALFGAPAHELLVDPAEWAYALRAAEDGCEAARVPRLAFQRRPLAAVVAAAEGGAGGGGESATVVVARDVLVWRVDSLEDTLVGYAVAVRGGWEQQ